MSDNLNDPAPPPAVPMAAPRHAGTELPGQGGQVVLTTDAIVAARGGAGGDIAANTTARNVAIAQGHVEDGTTVEAAAGAMGTTVEELQKLEPPPEPPPEEGGLTLGQTWEPPDNERLANKLTVLARAPGHDGGALFVRDGHGEERWVSAGAFRDWTAAVGAVASA